MPAPDAPARPIELSEQLRRLSLQVELMAKQFVNLRKEIDLLPRCCYMRCRATATQQLGEWTSHDLGCDDRLDRAKVICDHCVIYEDPERQRYDLPQAVLIRRLDEIFPGARRARPR